MQIDTYKKTQSAQTTHKIEGRVPPNAVEAEKALLGGLMLDRQAIAKAMEVVNEDSFYNEKHRIIFSTIIEMFDKAITVDIVTLSDELRVRKELDRIGGPAYLAELNNTVPTAANVEFHARIVQERYLKRYLIKTLGELETQVYDDSIDAFECIDLAEAAVFKIGEKRVSNSFASMKQMAKEAYDVISHLRERDKNSLPGVPSGIDMLDRMLGGFQNSDLIILAGRPSMGKTAFALSVVRNMAVDYKKPVAFFSIEMANIQLVMRLLSSESGIDQSKIRNGYINEEQNQKIIAGLGKLADAPLFIDDSPMVTITELKAKCRRLKAEHNISMVVVDYLQLVHAPKSESREREISIISSSLKQIAKELNIPVMALAQLNRSVESRNDKKPMLSDLRESGSIEQDADVVMFVNRPERYGQLTYEDGTPTENTGEIIIAKHRNGEVGTVRTAFIKEYARFANLALEYEERFIPQDQQNDDPGF